MKTEAPDPLLQAVLNEDAAFRRNTLRQTLALARRRRRTRFAGRVLAVAALLGGVAFLLRPPTPAPAPQPIAAEPALRIIRSAPLAAGTSVRTSDALFSRVSSAPRGLTVFTSQPKNIARIETRTSAPMLDYLDDKQLLAAFPGQHPALIAPGTEEARLVFY